MSAVSEHPVSRQAAMAMPASKMFLFMCYVFFYRSLFSIDVSRGGKVARRAFFSLINLQGISYSAFSPLDKVCGK